MASEAGATEGRTSQIEGFGILGKWYEAAENQTTIFFYGFWGSHSGRIMDFDDDEIIFKFGLLMSKFF